MRLQEGQGQDRRESPSQHKHNPLSSGPIVGYDDHFFDWLQGQVLMIEDYAYAGLDFRCDPELVFSEDAQWGDIGKKYSNF